MRPAGARQGWVSPRAYQKQQVQLHAGTTDEARALRADEEVLGVVAADRGQQRTQVAFDWESEAKALARENREKEVTVARLVKTREHKQKQAETQMLRYSELVSDEASRAPADEDLPTRRDVVIASMPTASKMLATDVERLLSPRLQAGSGYNPLARPQAILAPEQRSHRLAGRVTHTLGWDTPHARGFAAWVAQPPLPFPAAL